MSVLLTLRPLVSTHQGVLAEVGFLFDVELSAMTTPITLQLSVKKVPLQSLVFLSFYPA